MISRTMAELRQILEKTLSQSPEDQNLALEFLKHAVQQNFPEFVKQLSDLLRTDSSDFVRQAAGLQLKNVLVAKDEEVKNEYLQRWLAQPIDVREYTKNNVIETLGTEKIRPSIAAQCVASIACAEIPYGQWLESINRLMQNVTQPDSTEMLKESSLEALGYICQDINASVLGALANEILTAIVHGMKKQEPSNHVRLAATKALANSLEFTRTNFENTEERHVIMQVVCEATQSPEKLVKVAALECLVKIMSLYYEHMEYYMGPALFAITIDAMKSSIDEVCLQGIEFWSNVCEEEIDLSVEAEEAEQEGRPPTHVSKFYAKGAMQHLIPILTEALAKQEEGDDDDEWNPAKAAGVCLMLLAQCVGDEVVGHTLPFITTNIVHENWRYRDAAVMAFGSVLEGPEPEKLKPLVLQALPLLINLMTDQQTVVRDTAAWCIGRVCDVCQDVVVQPDILENLLPALSQGLHQEPRVAANVCWALSSLAVATYEHAVEQSTSTDDSGQPDTYILSPCFDAIVEELLRVTNRDDAHQSNLRIAAYEALMEMIKNSPKDCYPSVQKTTIIILRKLEQLLAMEGTIQSSSEKSQFHDLQSLLCATLQSVLRKMKTEDAPLISDTVMGALLQIMSHSAGKEGGGVMEDALMAVSTLIEVLGQGFSKYMEVFKPFLVAGLKNHEEYQVCFAAVGLIGDLCRALEIAIMESLDEFMGLMLEILQDAKIDKSVKPQVLSTFGDIALAIGPQFGRYFEIVLTALYQASQAKVEDKSDYDAVDYLNDLRESCLEAYTGIIQGLRSQNNNSNELKQLEPHVNNMISFLELIAVDNHPGDTLLGNAAGLIGDLVCTYGAPILPAFEKEPVNSLLVKGRRSKTTKTKTLANWATKEIRKVKNTTTTTSA